jgi:predicted enzyme related to lactoylglutathione lyase/VanZ family protein
VTGAPPIDILVAYRAQALVVFALVVVACVVIGYVLARNRQRGEQMLWVLAGVSLLVVLALTLVPSGGSAADAVECAVQVAAPTFGRIELMANIALFFPLTFFATLASRRPLLVLAAGAGLSGVVEAIQAVAPVIGRACDTNDWVMNTIGTVVGVAIAWVVLAARDRLARRSAPRLPRRSRAGYPSRMPHVIDYFELAVDDLEQSKTFYAKGLGWGFNDYGPDYAGIQDPRTGGEFGGLALQAVTSRGEGVLALIRTDDADAALASVLEAGGRVVVAMHDYPGGRRFTFADPSGNVLGVYEPAE